MKTLLLLAFVTIGCLFTVSIQAAPVPASDSEVTKALLGLWRSPRHEYEFNANGKVYMLPKSADSTTGTWSVKGATFFWDKEPYAIVSLSQSRFVYKTFSAKDGHETFILNRISAKMVGQPYNRESVK